MKYFTHRHHERAKGIRKWYEIRSWVSNGKIIRWELWSMEERWRWWPPFLYEDWRKVGEYAEHRFALKAMIQASNAHFGETTRYNSDGTESRGSWA